MSEALEALSLLGERKPRHKTLSPQPSTLIPDTLNFLSTAGRPNKRLESLLPLGTPLWRRKPTPSPDKSRGGISIAETLDELERSQDAEFERPRDGGVAMARQQGRVQSGGEVEAERVEDDLPGLRAVIDLAKKDMRGWGLLIGSVDVLWYSDTHTHTYTRTHEHTIHTHT